MSQRSLQFLVIEGSTEHFICIESNIRLGATLGDFEVEITHLETVEEALHTNLVTNDAIISDMRKTDKLGRDIASGVDLMEAMNRFSIFKPTILFHSRVVEHDSIDFHLLNLHLCRQSQFHHRATEGADSFKFILPFTTMVGNIPRMR